MTKEIVGTALWVLPLVFLAVMVVGILYNVFVLRRTEPPHRPWTQSAKLIGVALLAVWLIFYELRLHGQ